MRWPLQPPGSEARRGLTQTLRSGAAPPSCHPRSVSWSVGQGLHVWDSGVCERLRACPPLLHLPREPDVLRGWSGKTWFLCPGSGPDLCCQTAEAGYPGRRLPRLVGGLLGSPLIPAPGAGDPAPVAPGPPTRHLLPSVKRRGILGPAAGDREKLRDACMSPCPCQLTWLC